MNSNKALPWILVLIFAASAGFLFVGSQKKEKELAQLRQESAELPQLRTALEQAKKEESGTDISAAEKAHQELIRLRNEVGILRREKGQITTQLQQAKQNNERILQTQETQQAQLQQRNQQLVQQMQGDNARRICINNLRQIDGAKQQWALENKQPPTALAVAPQIEPYLSGLKLPVCPSGGVYTINAVNAAPTCSIAGHGLPP